MATMLKLDAQLNSYPATKKLFDSLTIYGVKQLAKHIAGLYESGNRR